jgi:hypothetical protein
MTQKNNSCKTYLYVVGKEDKIEKGIFDDVEGEIKKYTADYIRKNDCIEIGENTLYNVDVNVMIRQTIKDFAFKCKEIKELINKFNLEIYLEIVPQIVADSQKPRQILSLDDDIIAFLYNSSIKLDLDYYIV